MSVEFCECTSSYYVNNNSWQICKKNPFGLNIFFSHMKYGRKIIIDRQSTATRVSSICHKGRLQPLTDAATLALIRR